MDSKVAVITGGNSGVGYAIADRLLTEHENIHICLACRNQGRAENARRDLLTKHQDADISIVIMDTSSVKSVIDASDVIRKRFHRLDYLFLNAGIMKVSSLNVSQIAAIFTSRGAQILSTGEGFLNHYDSVTSEGLQEVFTTNLFGHFVMVQELADHVGGAIPTQVIWSSSQTARISDSILDLNDVQHRNGADPYTSSKYATDMISIGLNQRFNKQGIYSVVTCPGLVLSNMTFSLMAIWLWKLALPFLYFMRLFVKSLTCSPYNGAESLIWVTKQDPASLDPRLKYNSNCSVFGQRYIGKEKLSMKDEDVDNLYDQLHQLYTEFKAKYAGKPSTNGINGHVVNCENSRQRHVKPEINL